MIPEFAIRLICGLSMSWALAPRATITSGFFRIQMLLTMGLSVLLTLTSSQIRGFAADPNQQVNVAFWAGIVVALVSFWGSVLWTLERRQGGTICAFLVLAVSLGILIWIGALGSRKGDLPGFAMVDQFSAAFLIGSVTAAMLLGHWYLTATGMKLTPLISLNRTLIAALIFRSGTALVTQFFREIGAHSMLWTLRWTGLIGPLILAVLTIQILRYRNTQSATGVLYAATILVFMGEMAASLIERAY